MTGIASLNAWINAKYSLSQGEKAMHIYNLDVRMMR